MGNLRCFEKREMITCKSYHMTQLVITIMAPESDSKKFNSGLACGPILPRVMPNTVANTTSPRMLVPGSTFSFSSQSSMGTNIKLYYEKTKEWLRRLGSDDPTLSWDTVLSLKKLLPLVAFSGGIGTVRCWAIQACTRFGGNIFLTRSINVSMVETFFADFVVSAAELPTPGWIETTRIIPKIR